ncbi:hypothetical protein LNO36_20705 [Klebsiella variicola subsp. variicola]|nr:hypothetical protein [Klebsiella variicola subsp. variicola]
MTRRTIFELRKARGPGAYPRSAGRCAGQHRPDYRTDPSRADPGRSESGAGCPGVDLGNVAAMLERAGDDAARPEWLEPEFGVPRR